MKPAPRFLRGLGRVLLAALAAIIFAGAALAGQNCEPRRPSLDSIRRDLALAASVAEQLDAMARRDGTRVVLIARAGQDLSQYGLRYSHLGIAYRDDAALDGRGAWRVPYQQSNQWAIETLALLADSAVISRAVARDWLRAHDYRPTTLQISSLTRLGARVSSTHIAFDDHPFGRRMAGQIDTVTVDSVFAWIERSGLGAAPLRLRTQPAVAPRRADVSAT